MRMNVELMVGSYRISLCFWSLRLPPSMISAISARRSIRLTARTTNVPLTAIDLLYIASPTLITPFYDDSIHLRFQEARDSRLI